MTVPVTGNLPTWKSSRRCLPEIHASRLSVSGSLRPKLGLLILFVVLVVSLVLIAVPLVTKYLILASNPSSNQPLQLTLLNLLPCERDCVVSPSLLHHSLALLAPWLQEGQLKEAWCNRVNCTTNSTPSDTLHNISFFLPSEGTYSQRGKEWRKNKEVHILDWKVTKAKEQIRSWIRTNGGGDVGKSLVEDVNINHISLLGNLNVIGRVADSCSSSEKEKQLVVIGDFLTHRTETSFVARVPLLSDMILELRTGDIRFETVPDSEFIEKKLKLTFPPIFVTSEQRLEKVIKDSSISKFFGVEMNTPLLVERIGGVKLSHHYHRASFSVKCGGRNISKILDETVDDVNLSPPLNFLVFNKFSSLPIFMGSVVSSHLDK